jgi:hypothetical protein
MYLGLFFTVLPALLGAIAPSLALPLPSSRPLLIEARSRSLSSDTIAFIPRDVSAELLVKQNYQDGVSDLLAQAINEDLLPRAAARPKKTAAEAHQRKAAVRAKVAINQANNAAKKIHLEAEAAKLTYVNYRVYFCIY